MRLPCGLSAGFRVGQCAVLEQFESALRLDTACVLTARMAVTKVGVDHLAIRQSVMSRLPVATVSESLTPGYRPTLDEVRRTTPVILSRPRSVADSVSIFQ